MNKERRKTLERAKRLIEDARNKVDEAKGIVEEVRGEEQDYFDNMPESLQSGDKGSAADAAVGELDSAWEILEEIDTSLDDIVTSIDSAME
jgi:hypothetical protein